MFRLIEGFDVYVPSFSDYCSLKAKITELESELNALRKVCRVKDSTIERLRRKCGVKTRTSKTDVIEMLCAGASTDEILLKIGCSKSTINRAKNELKGVGYEL